MNDWRLVYNGFSASHEGLREALCTLGNGYFATRGAAPEAKADEVHYPGTYMAGCFNRLKTDIAGKTLEEESLVNLPNWLDQSFRLPDGDWFRLEDVDVLEYEQALDLQCASLKRTVRFRDAAGRHTRIEEQRFISMHQPHLAALSTQIFPEDWSGKLRLRSGLDGDVINAGVKRYRDLNSNHLLPISAESLNRRTMALEVMANQSKIRIALAASLRFWQSDDGSASAAKYESESELEPEPEVEKKEASIHHCYEFEMTEQKGLRIEKIVSLFNSRDRAISEPGLGARNLALRDHRFEELLSRHSLIWKQLWTRFCLDVGHDDPAEEAETEQILRLHIFHLLQTYSPHVLELDAGVPARGLHGEAYRGHIFWDELFVLPFFHLRMPAVSRAHLLYRYRRLDQARHDARAAGYRGAMYPWQSGSDGREESQRMHLNPKSGNWVIDNSRLQRHINLAVAFNVCHYYQATKDDDFLSRYGAEMLIEIARFWASKCEYNSARERYEIRGVMGPDEYHDSYPEADEPGLNNNAYTNVMVVWALSQALELGARLPGRRFTEICELLDLSREERDQWNDIRHRMYVPFHADGVISQFEGYESLEEFDWEEYRRRYPDIQRLDRILEAEGDTTNRYKLSKQADVLMLFFLFSAQELADLFKQLGYQFEHRHIPLNIEYYEQRTSHGSTLSRVTHSWVLARANREGCWPLFKQALKSDVDDIQGGTTAEGIHAGAMAGTVDLVQRCFTGLETRDDVLWLNPSLPKGMKSLALNVQYRKHHLQIQMAPNFVRLEVEPSEEKPILVGIASKVHSIEAGAVREFVI